MVSLVLCFVKSTCYITKPKCWVYLDSTPVASAVLGELLWIQILSRYSCGIYYQKLVTESFVNYHVLNLGITLIFFIYFYKLVLALHEFLQLFYWKSFVLPFVEAGFSIVQGENLWLSSIIGTSRHSWENTWIWPNYTLLKNYICPCSLVCLSFSGINSLKIPSVAFFSIVNKVNKHSTILSLFSCCIILIIWCLIQENKVMIVTRKKLLCQ